MTSAAPSGEQFELSHGAYRATVVEVGAGLRRLEGPGGPLIQGYAADAMCDGARGQLLLPWPNRIEGASYVFAGSEHQLPVTEIASGCAIHGLTRWAAWRCVDQTADSVLLAHRLHPRPGWPGTLDLTASYRLDDGGLTVTVTARNLGPTPLPFGAGAHPYLVAGSPPVDDWVLTLEADTVLHTGDDGLPTERSSTAGTDLDFCTGRTIGTVALDNPFTDIGRDEQGRIRVHLSTDDRGPVSIWADEHHHWFQVFTGDHLADQSRRRTAVAVEPMTCPPNAFRTGEDLIILEPDDEVALNWGIQHEE